MATMKVIEVERIEDMPGDENTLVIVLFQNTYSYVEGYVNKRDRAFCNSRLNTYSDERLNEDHFPAFVITDAPRHS